MGGYCLQNSRACELANDHGYCTVSACVKNTQRANVSIDSNMEDGLYAQLFAVKGGVRYDMKIVSLKDVTNVLTNSLMDGLETLCVR